MWVFATVINCRKCVAFFLKDVEMADVEGVPDQPKLGELLDSRPEDITDEKVVNKSVPSEGQDPTKEQNVGDTSRE